MTGQELSTKEGGFRLHIQNELPTQAVPNLEVLKGRLAGALDSLSWGGAPSPRQEVELRGL